MDSTRQQKFSRLIQKELADIFQRETRALFGSPIMITVTQTRVSPDLSVAKVYLSLFPVSDKSEWLDRIREKRFEIRHQLGNRIRNQARIVPELVFYIDDSLDYADRINELLKK